MGTGTTPPSLGGPPLYARQLRIRNVVSASLFSMLRHNVAKPSEPPHNSRGIRPAWSDFSVCAQCVAKDQRFLHADSEDSDQPGRKPRLIFAGRTVTLLICHVAVDLCCGSIFKRPFWKKKQKKKQQKKNKNGFIMLWRCPVVRPSVWRKQFLCAP